MHDEQLEGLADALETTARGHGELTKSVNDLARAVGTLESCTSKMQTSMETFVTNTAEGRKQFEKMLGEAIERKTGSWVLWIIATAILSMHDWLPELLHWHHG